MIFLLRYWQPIALAVLIAGVIAAYNWRIAAAEKVGADRVYAEWREATDKAIIEETANEAKKQADMNKQKEIVEDAAIKQIKVAQSVARSERAAAEQLREQLAAIGSSSGAACATTGTLAVSSAIRAVADVAGQCVAEYQQLAEAARSAYDAGKTCERQYREVAR